MWSTEHVDDKGQREIEDYWVSCNTSPFWGHKNRSVLSRYSRNQKILCHIGSTAIQEICRQALQACIRQPGNVTTHHTLHVPYSQRRSIPCSTMVPSSSDKYTRDEGWLTGKVGRQERDLLSSLVGRLVLDTPCFPHRK